MDAYDQTGEAFPGGNPVNVAVYTVRLGGEASYTGVVGDDAYGKLMKDSIEKKGVDVSHLKVMPGSTAVTHVEIIDGERILGDYEEGVMADFKLSEEDIEFLGSHDLVVSGIWGMIENDLEKIKACGTRIAFDFATKYESPVIDIAIPFVDYAFFAYDGEDEEWMRNFMEEMQKKGRAGTSRAGKIALYGMMTALAFLLSYVETLIPINLGVPGVKLGLANLASIVSLYLLGAGAAAAIALVRIVLVGFTFGNLSMMLYSLAGAAVSLLLMVVFRRLDWFGVTGVSILGGAGHNIGQLIVAALVVENASLFYYLPVLLAAGTAAGALIGLLGGILVNRLKCLDLTKFM